MTAAVEAPLELSLAWVAGPLEVPPRPPAFSIDAPSICDVLAAWRAAERELACLDDQDADWHRVHADVVGLRALHHRLFVARLDADGARSSSTARFPGFAAFNPLQLTEA